MYDILKNIITAGGYKLADMQHKIKKLHLLGDLTEEQMDQLLAMTSGNVSTDAERPAVVAMLQSIDGKVEALAARVAKLESGSSDEGTNDGEAEGFPAWEPWDGISNKYQQGAIVTHQGQLWVSTFTGQNVWEPGTPGTEALWSVYND